MAKHKVTGKQTVSHNCFICGEDNKSGLRMPYYNMDDGSVVGFFTGGKEHCSYDDRMHGGVITAILDETIGRAVCVKQPEMLGVTTEITVKYRKPVPLNVELKCIGRLDRDSQRFFKGSGEILGPDNSVLAEATASFLKIDPIKMLNEKQLLNDELYFSNTSKNFDEIEY